MARRPQFESLETRRLLASDWQNSSRSRDVSGDGQLSPLDVLLGINRLNSPEISSVLPAREAGSTEPFYDVSGDNIHSPIDILLVVNALNGGLFIDASLQNDTGVGSGANNDGVTTDLALRGFVEGSADYFRIRLAEDVPWQDVSDHLLGTGSFEISSDSIGLLLGHEPSDGLYQVDFEVGDSTSPESLPDRTSIEFVLDRTQPTSNVLGEILMESPDQIIIPLSEIVSEPSLDITQIKLYDITWGEKTGAHTWNVNGEFPRFELVPQSAEIASSGRALVITPPTINRSVKYLVELGAVVQDAAGNTFDYQTTSSTSRVRANYFAPHAELLSFGNTYQTSIEGEARILEYAFDLPSDDVLIWPGDQVIGPLSRFQLFDDFGNLLHELRPNLAGGPGTAQQPVRIPLPPGGYRLRAIDAPAAYGIFRLYRESGLSPLPVDRSLGNSDIWPLDTYEVSMVAGTRQYFVSLESTEVVRAVFDPLGRQVSINQSDNHDQYFDAPLSGHYIVLVNRVGYQSFATTAQNETVTDINAPIAGRLDKPGQIKNLQLAATSGEIYLFDMQDVGGGITTTLVGVHQSAKQLTDRQWLVRPESDRIDLRLERLTGDPSQVDYIIRYSKVSATDPLPVDTSIPGPAVGQFDAYQIPDELAEPLLLEGDVVFYVVELKVNGLNVRPHFGSVLLSPLSPASFVPRLVLIGSTASSQPWRAIAPERISRELDFDAPNLMSFEHGLEQFEFAFEAQPGEFVTSLRVDAGNGRMSNLFSTNFSLLDPLNRIVPTVNSGPRELLWQIGIPGDHRLVVRGDGISTRGQAAIATSISRNWAELSVGNVESIDPQSIKFYSIPIGTTSLVLSTDQSSRVITWRVFDQNGSTIISASTRDRVTRLPKDLHVELLATELYFLKVDNSESLESFAFQQL